MSGKSDIAYMPYIDGLRGLAVWVILLFHLDVALFGGGFIGVDIFFVISGFLITSIITREMAAGSFSFRDFYARRIRRIFPALFVMLLFASIGAVLFSGLTQYGDFFKSLRYASLQISNFFFAREVDYFAPGNDHAPLLHTWSLGVEEQFYLIWPLLLLLVRKYAGWSKAGIILAGVFAISLGMSEYLVRTDAMQAFYMLHARAWQLALGGLVAVGIFPPVKQRMAGAFSIAALLLMIAPVFLYNETNVPGVKALIPCLGAALLIYAAQSGLGMGHKILSSRPLIWTGLISYSLYLWHWPIIAFYKDYFGADLSIAEQIGLGAAAFICAILSYIYVEQPFRRSKVHSGKVIAAGLAVIAAFILTSNVVKKFSDSSWRVTYDVLPDVRDPHDLDRVCSVPGGAYDLERCVIGPDKGGYEIILTGDSHASHYAPMILAWARERGLTVRLFTRGACKAWLKTDKPVIRNGKPDTYCMKMTDDLYGVLSSQPEIKYVFIAARLPEGSEDTRRSLARLKESGKTVVYLGGVPHFRQNPHDCQIKNNLLISKWFPRKMGDCYALDKAYVEQVLSAMHAFRGQLQEFEIPYFDPVGYLLSPVDAQGRFMYMDEQHINRHGSAHLVTPFHDFTKGWERGRP